jgi:molybdopterin-guanine dinucleotide biosynthesis protein A
MTTLFTILTGKSLSQSCAESWSLVSTTFTGFLKSLKPREKSFACLILAKKNSSRLPNKNTLDFKGKPMFLVNVEKCLKLFKHVYVSSDDLSILAQAEKAGAKPIMRNESLCGDCPNIPVYQQALLYMPKVKGIVAVQANSPTIKEEVIKKVIKLIKKNNEVMTCHRDGDIYGSVWAIKTHILQNYGDPYKPYPNEVVIDNSIDIHTESDYQLALTQYA